MSENGSLSDGTPVATFDDAVEFLTKRNSLPCPSCGYSKWSVFTSHEKQDSHMGFGIVGLQLNTGGILTHGAPLVLTTCKKCAFVKMHNLVEISKWAANGKPGFEDNE